MLYVDNINTQYFVLWLHYCAHLSNNWAIFFGDSVHVESHTDRQSQASKSCLRDKPNDMHSHEWFGQIFGNWFPQGLGTKVLPVGHSVSNLSFLTVCLMIGRQPSPRGRAAATGYSSLLVCLSVCLSVIFDLLTWLPQHCVCSMDSLHTTSC